MSIEQAIANVRGRLLRHAPMAEYVSWRAGGAADWLFEPADVADLQQLLTELPSEFPLMWVGLGSNLLVRDGGWHGMVIRSQPGLRAVRRVSINAERGEVYAEAGVALPKLARFCAGEHLSGAAFMAGIPGTVGGALAMNAGCYGSETWQMVDRVTTIDRRGVLHERGREAFMTAYREVRRTDAAIETQSETQSETQDEEGFVGAYFSLPVGDSSLEQQEMAALLRRRSASQPLGQPNAGSVFRNPPGDHAARLIEACGLKGQQAGGAQVSTKHANFIVNTGSASAADIEQLIELVAQTVERQTGVRLQREVRIVGEKASCKT